jgi:hypothetical protein
MRTTALICLVLLVAAGLTARAEGAPLQLSGDGWGVTFDPADGSIASITGADGMRAGLWSVRFLDGRQVSAADFALGKPGWSFSAQRSADGLVFEYAGEGLRVRVRASAGAHGIDLRGSVTPSAGTVLAFGLPGRMRFDPARIRRVIFPMGSNSSVGSAFLPAFFQPQPKDSPAGWEPVAVGPSAYAALYGGPLDQRADADAAVALRASDTAQSWLSAGLLGRLRGMRAVVNRPPAAGQADLVLVDSPNGPWFSASSLGGRGRIWRVGGPAAEGQVAVLADIVRGVLTKLAAQAPGGPSKVGLIALRGGPPAGGWTSMSAEDWRQALSGIPGADCVEIATPAEMMDALLGGGYLAITNPYGEWCPVPSGGSMADVVKAVREYVRAGGEWFETGGYSFYYALRPRLFYAYSTPYPPAFADSYHVDAAAGGVSVYGVQAERTRPWAGASDHALLFVPGNLSCGGDDQGGYCAREFATYVRSGETWQSPVVRISVGRSAREDIADYCAANRIERGLSAKMAPDVLERFKRSVLVKYDGTCREDLAHLGQLPQPCIIHFSNYLHGGFDKQYPDHLPPNAAFGTPAELREFIDQAHALGDLVMPYTNPTWWCDHPRGPTFEREGEGPLLRTLDGKLSYERYAANDGYTVCHWAPAVQAANRRTLSEFTHGYPVDILFEDQCGARGWLYDMNPFSPTPYAYTDGLISMVQEDSATAPLSTECGWDGIANYESQFCGLTWQIVPTEHAPAWRSMLSETYAPNTWRIYPLAERIAHDKVAMAYHDLGQFVTNRQVLAWALGLGFCMSYSAGPAQLDSDAERNYLLYLDRVQKSVCARYVGQPVGQFAHERPGDGLGDGFIDATYGDVRVLANLEDHTLSRADERLQPFGFSARAPGLVAGDAETGTGERAAYVVERSGAALDVWVYARPATRLRLRLPDAVTGQAKVVFDGQPAAVLPADNGELALDTPAPATGEQVSAPPDLAGTAPLRWPDGPPAIGVLSMQGGLPPALAAAAPQAWLQAFRASGLCREDGVQAHAIETPEQLRDALQAGAAKWLVIVNPYGETLPVAAGTDWRGTLDMVRAYVRHGGCWWETGGYSFYRAAALRDGRWDIAQLGPAGMGRLGLPVGAGADEPVAEPLQVTDEGRGWLGDDLALRIQGARTAVNRPLGQGFADPGHRVLVVSGNSHFLGAYRLEGWGWLWRLGGFSPDPQVALPVAVAITERLYREPPEPPDQPATAYLYHATVRVQAG